MSNDSRDTLTVAELDRGRDVEQHLIVKWLKERALSYRAWTTPSDPNRAIAAEHVAEVIEGLAAAIERGSHRGPQ